MKILLLFPLLTVFPGLFAADPTPVPIPAQAVPAGISGIRLRIFVPPIQGILTSDTPPPTLPGRVRVETESGFTDLRLTRNSYTHSVTVRPGTSLRLFRLTPSGEQGDVLAEAEIPKDTDMAVGFLDLTSARGADGISLRIFPLPSGQTPAGWHTFQNELQHEVELKVKDQVHHIAPNGQISLDVGPGRERIFIREHGGKQSRSHTTAVYSDAKRGMFHLICPREKSTRRIELISLSGPELSTP